MDANCRDRYLSVHHIMLQKWITNDNEIEGRRRSSKWRTASGRRCGTMCSGRSGWEEVERASTCRLGEVHSHPRCDHCRCGPCRRSRHLCGNE